jgi:hypothetical protein
MDLQESLLHHVLSRHRVSREPHNELVQFLRVTTHQELEARGLAVQVFLQ